MENWTYYLIAGAVLLLTIILVVLLRRKSTVHKKEEKKGGSEKIYSADLTSKLNKTRKGFLGKLYETISARGKVDEDLIDELEEIMLQADIGVKASMDICDQLREEITAGKVTDPGEIRTKLEKIITDMMQSDYSETEENFKIRNEKPYIILFSGVNGVGKTTTIGKLAKRFVDQGKSVVMVAADTFRAAASEQLAIWAERAGAEIVKQQSGADPSSVVYDGVMSAVKKDRDIVLIDTAGRQHTKVNLMNELGKINRTIKKIVPDGPHETLMVIDATTGQNAISQTEIFNKAIDLTGLVLTKLDGTAKGGIVIGIKHQLNIPVKLIGVGEALEDLRDFKVNDFIQAIFDR